LQNVLRQFVLNGEDGSLPDQVLKLPGSAFAASEPSRSVTLRRLWLDTFDWRLYRSGLALEQVSRGGAAELVLTGRDGQVIAADHLVTPHGGGRKDGARRSRPAWPGLLDTLPLGPLRDHLGPVVGVRALLPVARAVSVVRGTRVLNSDEKTIARITVDRMSVTYPAAGSVPPRLVVSALRGYGAQALRVADLLAAEPGVAEAGQSGLEAVLAAAGRRPGDYTGKVDVKLTPRMPAAVAMTTVLTALFDTLTANVNGTVRDIDTEFLHDLRVAVRRTRSALKLTGDVLPGDMAARFRPEFKWLGDLTTPTRDLDVYLLGYAGMAAGLVAAWCAAAPQRTRNWPAACVPPGSPGSAGTGRTPWPMPTAARAPPGGTRSGGWPPTGSAAPTGACCATAARSPPPRRRKACTTCASAARNSGTCWNSSDPCTILASTGRRSGS